MIVPTKGIAQERALLTLGARILFALNKPVGVSALWDKIKRQNDGLHNNRGERTKITFDLFTLALAMLYSIGVLELDENGELRRQNVST